ncbi:MAG: hypothetical protein K6C13_15415 [Oscillospiraceae bacterium]|nr:hypothetical protein [Oscillospiraceae bacterium]
MKRTNMKTTAANSTRIFKEEKTMKNTANMRKRIIAGILAVTTSFSALSTLAVTASAENIPFYEGDCIEVPMISADEAPIAETTLFSGYEENTDELGNTDPEDVISADETVPADEAPTTELSDTEGLDELLQNDDALINPMMSAENPEDEAPAVKEVASGTLTFPPRSRKATDTSTRVHRKAK